MANKLAAMLDTREAARPPAPRYEVGQYLPLVDIRTDGGTQARAGLDEDAVKEYAEAWLQLSHEQNGFLKMPLIIVFHDGESYWLADGFHRVEAYKRFVDGPSASASPRAIRAEIRSGTRRDAVLYACGANSTHGLKRTTEDKRRACARVLGDTEWREWSDSEIARRVNVDHKTVASVRAELESTGEIPSSPVRQSADGKARDVSGIAASNAKRTRQLADIPPPERRGEPQRPSAPQPMHPDEQRLADVERILSLAAHQGERTGTQMYQGAYDQARQIRDVTLYNRAFALIDRAVEGKPADVEQPKISEVEPPPDRYCGIRNCPRDGISTHQVNNQGAPQWFCDQHAPIIAALNTAPRRPVSEDSSAQLDYLRQLEANLAQLRNATKALLKLT
jgi:hypothetical protein